ncbi:MAG: TIGR01777 family oxidoreductase [Opitutales bacterium]
MSTTKNILISGATGLIGRTICPLLGSKGHTVKQLSRSRGDYLWKPDVGEIDPAALDNIDTVIHLAGETVAQRWTSAAKRRIMDSRVKSSELLVKEILKRDHMISYIAASGISYYGFQQGAPVGEASPLGAGFLAEVSSRWEAAAKPLIENGSRCVFVRTGVVLSPEGGALAKLLPPFKAGLGGKVGSGEQMMSWISLHDLVRIYLHCVEDEGLAGAVNAVSPHAVSNLDFTKALGVALKRPTVVPLPAIAVNILFGEMGRETILSDLNVQPNRLESIGFQWEHDEINDALQNIL